MGVAPRGPMCNGMKRFVYATRFYYYYDNDDDGNNNNNKINDHIRYALLSVQFNSVRFFAVPFFCVGGGVRQRQRRCDDDDDCVTLRKNCGVQRFFHDSEEKNCF